MINTHELNFRYSCGTSQQIRTLNDWDKLVSALCLHSCVLESLAELEQLHQGLTTLNFASLLESHASVLRPILQNTLVITSSLIQDLYTVEYSEIGSNKRRAEEEIIMTWINFLIACEGKLKNI